MKMRVESREENQLVTALGTKCSSRGGGKPAYKRSGERQRQLSSWFGMMIGRLKKEKMKMDGADPYFTKNMLYPFLPTTLS